MTKTQTAPRPDEAPQAIVPPANDLTPPREPTLAEKVSTAQARIAERTAPARARAAERSKAAAADAKQFVKDHPVIAVTGAVAIGALIALSLPGRPGRKVRGSVMTAGGVLGELAATYGAQLVALAENAAEESREKLGDIGERIADTSSQLAHDFTEKGEESLLNARHIGERAALAARQASEDAGFRTRTAVSRLRR